MLELKQNHIYLFSKQVPGSEIVEEFCAIFINIINDTLLVRDFTPFRIFNAQWQQLPPLIYAHEVCVLNEKRCKKGESNSCIRSMPKNWIVNFTLLEDLQYIKEKN